jgi:hypothetical protein
MPLRQTASFHQRRGNRRVTDPAIEPVTLNELKSALRISGSNEDTFLLQCITEAREEIEDKTGIAFITQTWKLTLDQWPIQRERWWDGMVEGHTATLLHGNDQAWKEVQIPRYPLITVDTITVYDEAGNSSAVTIADVFVTDAAFLRGRLVIKRGAVWPIALQEAAAIEIGYTAGYGASPTTIPSPCKRAIRNMAAYLYEHRGDGCSEGDAYYKSGASKIMNSYRDISV